MRKKRIKKGRAICPFFDFVAIKTIAKLSLIFFWRGESYIFIIKKINLKLFLENLN